MPQGRCNIDFVYKEGRRFVRVQQDRTRGKANYGFFDSCKNLLMPVIGQKSSQLLTVDGVIEYSWCAVLPMSKTN